MRAGKQGLCGGSDFSGCEPGTGDAGNGASMLSNQAAGIALLCAIALDAAAHGDGGYECDPADVAATASRLMVRCSDDLFAAVNLLG